MRTSEQTNELFAALAKAQGEMKSALKTATNDAFKNRATGKGSSYATLADCATTAHPTLSKHELCVVQCFDGGEFVARIGHSSGQWVEGRWPVPGNMAGMTIQQLVACQTYLRRASYSLVGLVADEDDDGNEAAKAGTITRPAKGIGVHSPLGDVAPDDNAIRFADAFREALAAGPDEVRAVHSDLHAEGEELYRNAWSLLGSKERTAIKKILTEAKVA